MKTKHFKETINGHTFWMKYIPQGSFDIGDEYGDLNSRSQPIQKDILISSFYMAEYPVTQALWKAVMGVDNNPSYFKGDNRPVEQVNWEEAKVFLKRLNETKEAQDRHKADGLLYRLPSESQWEYAARGSAEKSETPKFKYAGSDNLKEVGWFNTNSHRETKPVGLKLSNDFDLFDMSGNVWEWCEDVWIDNLEEMPKNGEPRTEKTKKEKDIRVVRGGSWFFIDYFSRVAYRLRYGADFRLNYIGLRLSRY